MSAFIVGAYHINVLVSYGVSRNAQYYVPGDGWSYFNEGSAPAIAAMLYSENVRSVNHRYSERAKRTGHTFRPESWAHLSPADIVRACDCLDYQSWEHKGWERSEAKRALRAIRERAIDSLTTQSSAWELHAPA